MSDIFTRRLDIMMKIGVDQEVQEKKIAKVAVYNKFIGIFLSLFGKTEYLNIKSENGHSALVWVNKRSLAKHILVDARVPLAFISNIAKDRLIKQMSDPAGKLILGIVNQVQFAAIQFARFNVFESTPAEIEKVLKNIESIDHTSARQKEVNEMREQSRFRPVLKITLDSTFFFSKIDRNPYTQQSTITVCTPYRSNKNQYMCLAFHKSDYSRNWEIRESFNEKSRFTTSSEFERDPLFPMKDSAELKKFQEILSRMWNKDTENVFIAD